MEQTYKTRHRIEVSTSVKGIKTYSCTAELVDSTKEESLKESDWMVAALDKRYPAPIEGVK